MTTSVSKKKRGSVKARAGANVSSKSRTDGAAVHLDLLLDEVAERIKRGHGLDPHVEVKIANLSKEVKNRAHEELEKPIKGPDEFHTRLRQIKRAYKQGDFNGHMRKACQNLYQYVCTNKLIGQPEYWKACTLVYELNDIFHIDPEINQWAFKVGKTIYESRFEHWEVEKKRLEKNRPKYDAELLREQILFCTCYGNELKRKGETEDALTLFETLFDFTSNVLVSDSMFAFATRAILSYHLGALYGLEEDHKLAEEKYSDALVFYYERSKTRQGDLDEFFFITRRVAMCVGLGLGRINLTRGYLGRAENALATARSLMIHIPDTVVREFIDMLYGRIRRCRAGNDKKQLRQAISILKKSHDFFDELNHRPHKTQACWELALSYNLIGDFAEAEKHLQHVEDFIGQGSNDKWKANVHILRSRILRNQGDYRGALSEAELALTTARSSKLILPAADALITRGEARLYLARKSRQIEATYANALEDFEAALKELQLKGRDSDGLGQTLNPKISAVCLLRIAQCYVRDGMWKEANAHLKKWRGLSTHVEHEWVHELAREVKKEFDGITHDFTVPADNPKMWNVRDRANEMRKWLVSQAMKYTKGDKKKVAILLGWTEKNVNNILKKPSGINNTGSGEGRKKK